MDQIVGGMWLLDRAWCDLILWAPDLPIGRMQVTRIARDEKAVSALSSALLEFDAIVNGYFERLSAAVAKSL